MNNLVTSPIYIYSDNEIQVGTLGGKPVYRQCYTLEITNKFDLEFNISTNILAGEYLGSWRKGYPIVNISGCWFLNRTLDLGDTVFPLYFGDIDNGRGAIMYLETNSTDNFYTIYLKRGTSLAGWGRVYVFIDYIKDLV